MPPAKIWTIGYEGATQDALVAALKKSGIRALVDTRDVSLDMQTKLVSGDSGVEGKLKLGTFRAQRLRGDVNSHVVTLLDRVHLHIVQQRR